MSLEHRCSSNICLGLLGFLVSGPWAPWVPALLLVWCCHFLFAAVPEPRGRLLFLSRWPLPRPSSCLSSPAVGTWRCDPEPYLTACLDFLIPAPAPGPRPPAPDSTHDQNNKGETFQSSLPNQILKTCAMFTCKHAFAASPHPLPPPAWFSPKRQRFAHFLRSFCIFIFSTFYYFEDV